jgi:hypothetical protein
MFGQRACRSMPDTLYMTDATNFLPPLRKAWGRTDFGKFQFKTSRCNCFDDHLNCTHLVNEPHVCKIGPGALSRHALNGWRSIPSVYGFLADTDPSRSYQRPATSSIFPFFDLIYPSCRSGLCAALGRVTPRVQTCKSSSCEKLVHFLVFHGVAKTGLISLHLFMTCQRPLPLA